MVYTILISVVFVAELIIAITIIQNLLRLDKLVQEVDEIVSETRPSVQDITVLMRKISEQWETLAADFVARTKQSGEKFLLRKLSKILLSLLVVKLNFKFLNKIRKARFTKYLVKGWSFLESMV